MLGFPGSTKNTNEVSSWKYLPIALDLADVALDAAIELALEIRVFEGVVDSGKSLPW